MLDTYVQNKGEAKGASCDTNRLESALLAHVMILVGVPYVCAYTYTSGYMCMHVYMHRRQQRYSLYRCSLQP